MTRIRSLLLISFSLLLIACFSVLCVSEFGTSSALVQQLEQPLYSWQTTVHVLSNAVFSWRISITTALLSLNPAQYCFLASALFGIGVVVCGQVFVSLGRERSSASDRGNNPFLLHLAYGMSSALLLPLLFGADPLVLSAIAWLPFVVATLFWLRHTKEQGRALLVLGCVVLLLTEAANQFAILIAISALVIESTLAAYLAYQNARGVENSKVSKNNLPRLAIAILCLLPLAVLFLAPVPTLPQYPPLAHVVPDDNIPGQISALVGPSTSIPVIDRSAVKSTYAAVSVFLLLATVLLLIWLLFLQKNSSLPKAQFTRKIHLALVPLVLAACLALDTLFPESVSQIAPIAAIARVIPGYFLLPLTPVLAALCFAMLCIVLVVIAQGVALLCAGLAALYFVVLVYGSNDNASRLVPNINAQIAKKLDTVEAILHDGSPYQRARLVSPSFRLISENQGRILHAPELFSRQDFQLPSPVPEVQVSGNSSEAKHLFDNDESTRWHSGAVAQQGNEWIHLRFAKPQVLDGIELATGNWRWDFPRGLEIRSSKTCTPDSLAQSDSYEEVVHPNSSWQGKIQLSKDHYPYYGGQDNVQIIFPQQITTHCLLIKQTSPHPVFQWSVAELRLLPAQQ